MSTSRLPARLRLVHTQPHQATGVDDRINQMQQVIGHLNTSIDLEVQARAAFADGDETLGLNLGDQAKGERLAAGFPLTLLDIADHPNLYGPVA